MRCPCPLPLASARYVGPRERGGLLGDVDADRAPGDAPAAAHAARLAELVVPGAELVGQPLPVPAAGGGAYRAAVQVREVQVEAGVPAQPTLRVLTGHVGDVLDGGAEAGRADQRAVAAGQAAL